MPTRQITFIGLLSATLSLWLPAVAHAASQAPALAETRTTLYHPDAIGSVRLTTAETGDVATAARYTPYGFALTSAASADETPSFAGKRALDATGTHDFGARHYATTHARFLSPDPIRGAAATNLYTYALNNPLKYIDPDGLDAQLAHGNHVHYFMTVRASDIPPGPTGSGGIVGPANVIGAGPMGPQGPTPYPTYIGDPFYGYTIFEGDLAIADQFSQWGYPNIGLALGLVYNIVPIIWGGVQQSARLVTMKSARQQAMLRLSVAERHALATAREVALGEELSTITGTVVNPYDLIIRQTSNDTYVILSRATLRVEEAAMQRADRLGRLKSFLIERRQRAAEMAVERMRHEEQRRLESMNQRLPWVNEEPYPPSAIGGGHTMLGEPPD